MFITYFPGNVLFCDLEVSRELKYARKLKVAFLRRKIDKMKSSLKDIILRKRAANGHHM